MTCSINTNDIVYQSNDLVEAIYDSDLTATEHKILRYAASKIRENSIDFPDVKFTVKEFMEAAGIKSNRYHQQFEKIADELTRKRIKIKNNEEIGWFPWLSALRYKNGVIYLSFNIHIKELIFELKNGYTRYEFNYIGNMRSPYTIRLFELIKQYAKIGRRRLKVDTLKQMLGVGDKYKQYGQFKLRVLQQAKKELDKKESLTFTFDEIKEGRKVVEIILNIKVNNPKLLERKLDNFFLKEAELLLDNYNYNIKKDDIRKWEKYGINLLSEVLEEIKGRNITYPKAYIEKVLEEKFNNTGKQIELDFNDENDHVEKFIKENKKSNEVLPDWFVEDQFIKYLNDIYEKEQIEKIWDQNKEYILKSLNR